VSPILVRPVREQFEHDRVIRVLQAKYKRKFEAAINPGAEQNQPVTVGELTMFPDVVLLTQEPRNRKIHGTIEVETAESINSLEAMAEWGPFSRLRTPFFLYVPANSIDSARRLCSDLGIEPAEIWTYHTAMDQIRFTMVHRSPNASTGTIAPPKVKAIVPPPAPEPEPEPPPPVADFAAARALRTAAAKVAKAGVGAKCAAKPAAAAAKPAATAAKGAPAAPAATTVKSAPPRPGRTGATARPAAAAKSAPPKTPLKTSPKAAAARTPARSNGAAKAKKAARPAKPVRPAKSKSSKTAKSASAARRR
jgi:hypothetical protein